MSEIRDLLERIAVALEKQHVAYLGDLEETAKNRTNLNEQMTTIVAYMEDVKSTADRRHDELQRKLDQLSGEKLPPIVPS